MNIKQIKYFIAVVSGGSLSAAAKSQYVTVQAVSKAIADLEQELGKALFVRESRGVRPTPFGRAFHQKAAEALESFEELEAFAQEYTARENESQLKLALCTPDFYHSDRARKSIASFVEKFVGVKVSVELMTGDECMELLATGDLDSFISIGTLSQPHIDCVPIGTVPPAVLMRKGHPLVHKNEVTLADINAYPLSVSVDFDQFNDSILAVYRRRGLGQNLSLIENYEKLEHHLRDNDGLVFVAGIPALGAMHPDTVIKLIAAEDAVPIPVCFNSLKGEKPVPYLALEKMVINQLTFLDHKPFKSDAL